MKKLNIKPLASLALAAPLAACSTEEQKPNIILFLQEENDVRLLLFCGACCKRCRQCQRGERFDI